jgi:hypothetical protein
LFTKTVRVALTGIGYHPKGYKPDQVNHVAYESYQNGFLQSSHGHTALSKGRVIAHLVQNVVTAQDVVYRPSDNVLDGALYLWDGKHSSLAYYNDQMSTDKEDIICSIYQVDTGQSHPTWGHQTTNLSWWPKPSAWKNSGLNTGYWSRDCETWDQRCLATI